jgi:hypothetical protein
MIDTSNQNVQIKGRKSRTELCFEEYSSCLLSLIFNPEDRGSTFLRNVGKLPRYKASQAQKMVFFIATVLGT